MAAFAAPQCHFTPDCFVFNAGSGSAAHQIQWASVLSSVENPAEIEEHFPDNYFTQYILDTVLTMTWHIFQGTSKFI